MFVIDSDLFAGLNVSQGIEQDVPVQVLHVGIRLAAVINVVGAVAAATAVQAPTAIHIADAEDSTVAATLRGFEIRDALARVFSDLFSALESLRREAAFAVDFRFSDGKPGSEF